MPHIHCTRPSCGSSWCPYPCACSPCLWHSRRPYSCLDDCLQDVLPLAARGAQTGVTCQLGWQKFFDLVGPHRKYFCNGEKKYREYVVKTFCQSYFLLCIFHWIMHNFRKVSTFFKEIFCLLKENFLPFQRKFTDHRAKQFCIDSFNY